MTNGNDIIGNELQARNDGKFTGNHLYFDPVDGELKVVDNKKLAPSPDSQVLDQIAEDGFL